MNILLVEDEIDYRESLAQLLNLHGFICNSVGSIAGYVAWSHNQKCDLLIVDRKLPDGDGIDIVKMHRQNNNSAIIMLTSLVSEESAVEGYASDCDLYLTKPIGAKALIAAIENIKRKRIRHSDVRMWVLDPVAWTLTCPQLKTIKLSKREVALIGNFIDNAGKPIERETIAQSIGMDLHADDYKKLEVVIRRFRNKVAQHTDELPLLTIYGQGFVFNDAIRSSETPDF